MKYFFTLFLAVLCALQGSVVQAKPRLLPLPQTRDNWRSVRTNHLFVIGNADAEKLRQVAAWLEFFHSAFGRLVSRNVLDSSVPTTVIIFRDDASFTPFKPFYQGRPVDLAGFFLPGEDVNYIALSLDPDNRDPFSTAFHEYVHLHLRDNVPGVPLWLNEGLAEFYGALQFSGNDALLGAPLLHYIRLLRDHELLPLSTLFSIGTNSPHYNEQDKTGIFYGQSWALVHYLMLGENGRQEQFKRFLQQVSRGENAAKAIEDSFGVTLATLEQDLKTYVRRGDLAPQRISVDNAQVYTSYTAMQRSSLSESEANHYLGDLLLHLGRDKDAEQYFKQAVAVDPGFIPPYESLGSMYVHQRRYAEAKKYLQKATTSSQNYLIHYYHAYVLSREGVGPDGRIKEYSKENAAAMREQLLQAIKLAPNYAPAYYLLALVDVVTEERPDEALQMAQKARQLAPAKSSYSMLLADIYLRRSDPASARQILESLTRDSDQSVRNEAKDLLESLSNTNPGSNRRSAGAPAVSSTRIAEPVQTGSVRMSGGASSGGAIRDGRTIETSASLPTVDEVLAKYGEAMGGAKAIDAVRSRVVKGSLDVVGLSRGGNFEAYTEAPNKTATMLQAYPLGNVKGAFSFFGPIRSKKVTLAGISKIGYRDVYVLDLQPAAGGAVERLYLDAQTYLPVRSNTVLKIGTMSDAVEMYFDNWKEVDGVKYPFFVSQRFPRLTLAYTVKEIRHNVAIDARVFAPR
jgi:tetratricopeptide (TPR) repeat protein